MRLRPSSPSPALLLMCVLCAAVGVTQLLGCSGAEEDGESCVEPGPERYISVSLGDTHGCAVRESGALQCWGDDEYGKVSGAPCTEFVAAAAGREQHDGVEDGQAVCHSRFAKVDHHEPRRNRRRGGTVRRWI